LHQFTAASVSNITMTAKVKLVLRGANDRSRGLYRVGCDRSLGGRQCRAVNRRRATCRSATNHSPGSAAALYHGSGAKKLSADERQFRPAPAPIGTPS